jgi:signal transduction histidine kinase/DNA-binding response OmpR family regulator/HPt (histidine-containing phosphotransfer) domain-containing protein
MNSWLKNFSLTAKTHIVSASALAIVVVAAFLIYSIGEGFVAHARLTEELQSTAAGIGDNLPAAFAAGDRPAARGLLETFRHEPEVRSVTLYDGDGKVFVHLPLVLGATARDEQVPAWSAAATNQINYPGLLHMRISVPVIADGARAGTILMNVDLAGLFDPLRPSALCVLFAGLLAALIGHAAAIRMYRSVIGMPFNDLLTVTRNAWEGKDFGIRGKVTSSDDIGVLTGYLNSMLAQLEKRDTDLRAYQSDLENRVRERTLRLDAAVVDAQETLEKVEASSRAKSEFLARMSHEIRTPMNAVIGMTQLLHATKLDDRQRRYADVIHQSGNALLGLINDILDFSKIEAGKLELDIAPFSLRDVVEDAVDILAEKAHGKGLELLCDIPADVETAVFGDGQRLRQIIINLVGNAVKFTERGEVRVTVRHQALDRQRTAFRFEVVDTGIGIKPESCGAIFESFAQEDNSTTRKYGGTGLGLAICKQLVELMGGEMGVKSTPGEGSTFHFTVALTNDDATARGLRPAALKGARVLIVEDNARARQIIAGHLKSFGVTVSEARSGPIALQMLEMSKVDHAAGAISAGAIPAGVGPAGAAPAHAQGCNALVIDAQLPNADGFALAKQIREQPEFADIPILIMTSLLAVPGVDEKLDGPTAWLGKPVRRSQLHSSLVSLFTSEPEVATTTVNVSRRMPVIVENPRAVSRVRRALLVEDNPVNQELALAMLLELGVSTVSAWSGEEALVKVAAEHFDVVLMDCQMPKLDGYAATRRLREWERRAGREHVPIVALTANALNGDAARCFEAGMDRYLSKPFTIDQLFRVLESCVPEAEQAQEAAAPVPPALVPAAAVPATVAPAVSAPPAAVPTAAVPATVAPAVPVPTAAVPATVVPAAAVPAAVPTAAVPATVAPAVSVPPAAEVVTQLPVRESDASSVVAAIPVLTSRVHIERAAMPRQAPAPEGAPERSPPVLDEKTLDQIRELQRGVPNLLAKVAEMYLENSTMLLDELRVNLNSKNAAGIAKAAHALKSTSFNVGAKGLGELCAGIEALGSAGRTDEAKAAWERLYNEHGRVVMALEALKAAA